jgi:antitoxin MazE
MKAHLVRIGNSRGIRLPKPLIEEAGLSDEVELRVRAGAIVITSASQPRAGWATAAARGHALGDDAPLMTGQTSRFDSEEWEW